MHLAPGIRLGPYDVLAPLGAGGMGEVYRARDTRLGRGVALKVLPASVVQDADRLMRFEREAKTLAALNHPHIAQIYGLEQAGDTSALVMELVEGEDLAQRIARGPLPPDDALPIARQIAEALEAAHEAGIVHRDLKPANIKVRPDGTVKVLDFGLAKALDARATGAMSATSPSGAGATGAPANSPTITSPAMTAHGIILGTAAYMSPEQARGQAIDARTDLWAFGCVLFEMLTGKRPFAGDTVTDILAGIVREEPPWDALPPETPAAIATLLRRCLRKDRRKRLASAADARLDLEEAFDPDVRRTPVASVVTTRRSPIWMALAGVAAVAVLMSGYALGSRAAVGPTTPAPATRFVVTAPPGTQIVSGHRELAISPDGQQIAFIARGAAGQHIYIRRIDTLEPQQVPGTDGARDLAFSPDGRWLAFHAGNRIRKIRIDGSLPTVLAEAVHSHGLAWHPTEDTIYFAPFELSPIWKVQADGQTPAVQVTTLDTASGERSHEWPVIVDDGRALLFAVNANGSDLEELTSLLTLSTNVRTTIRGGGSPFGFTESRDLLLVRERSLVGARYERDRLASPELLDEGSAVDYPALSPSGTLAYVPAPDYRRRSVAWYSPDGQVSDTSFGQRAFAGLALSPDGRRVALNVFDDGDSQAMYVADGGGGPLTQVARPSGTTPSWSPDGRWIAETVRQSGAGGWALARVAMEPGRNWETLAAAMAEDIVSQWTPDGLGLLFSRRDSPTGRRFPMRLALDRSPPAASDLVDGGGNHIVQSPALSPDGRWLAYESNESGRLEVYVQSYPSATARIQVSRDGGAWPTWSKRGDALYFANGDAILSSRITTQPELGSAPPRTIVTDPLLVRPIAGARSFDVAPDGRILAIREDGRVRSDHIVVVQNWLGEGRRSSGEGRR